MSPLIILALLLSICSSHRAGAEPERISRSCPLGCSSRGNCNAELGRCECRFGYGGMGSAGNANGCHNECERLVEGKPLPARGRLPPTSPSGLPHLPEQWIRPNVWASIPKELLLLQAGKVWAGGAQPHMGKAGARMCGLLACVTPSGAWQTGYRATRARGPAGACT